MARRDEGRITRAQAAMATAEDRARQAEDTAGNRCDEEVVRGAASVLGGLLGGRGGVRSIIRSAGGVAAHRNRTAEAAGRADAARNRVGETQEAPVDLEAEVADALATITEEWAAREAATTLLEVPLGRTDIRVVELALVSIPVG